MSRPFSAYAALDLEPGADRAAVEEAYRRLIKLYHPDRSGGDGVRAAEINRAYRELRSGPISGTAPVSRPSQSRPRRKPRRRIPRWPVIVAGVILLALMQSDAVMQSNGLMQQGSSWANRLADAGAPIQTSLPRPNVARNSLLDGPVDAADIAESIEEAVRIVKSGDEQALTDRSRDCHRKLRLEPQLALLDRCAAFDSTVAALLDRDPGQDTGQFNASSVTARQLTAASLMSGDYLAIERRLNRIRSQVELALMPAGVPPVQQEILTQNIETTPADVETGEIEP